MGAVVSLAAASGCLLGLSRGGQLPPAGPSLPAYRGLGGCRTPCELKLRARTRALVDAIVTGRHCRTRNLENRYDGMGATRRSSFPRSTYISEHQKQFQNWKSRSPLFWVSFLVVPRRLLCTAAWFGERLLRARPTCFLAETALRPARFSAVAASVSKPVAGKIGRLASDAAGLMVILGPRSGSSFGRSSGASRGATRMGGILVCYAVAAPRCRLLFCTSK